MDFALVKDILAYHPLWVAVLSFGITQVVKFVIADYGMPWHRSTVRLCSVLVGFIAGGVLIDLPVREAFGAGLAIGAAVFASYDTIVAGQAWVRRKLNAGS